MIYRGRIRKLICISVGSLAREILSYVELDWIELDRWMINACFMPQDNKQKHRQISKNKASRATAIMNGQTDGRV